MSIKNFPNEEVESPVKLKNDPRDSNLRWILLSCACMLTLGTYYGHDSIGVFQIHFEKTFGLSTTAFNSLATAFYLPCTFMPILAGILSEKYGIRPMIVSFSILVFIGEGVLAFGVYNRSFKTMIIGRAIHGFGHDSMLALNKAVVAKWFYRKDLALAIALTMSASRFGSSLSGKIGAIIYSSSENLTYPFIFACLIGLFSALCCISLSLIDAHVEKRISAELNTPIQRNPFNWRDLKNLKYISILLILTYFLVFPPFFSYSNNNAAVLVTRFGFDMDRASDFNMVLFIIATVMTPFIGYISDKYGNKANILITSAILQLLSHLFIILIKDTTEINYYLLIPNITMGLGLACFASAYWPSLTIVTKESLRATSFGITYAGMNIILASLMIVLGEIKDSTLETSGGYFWTQVLLAGICILGLGLAYLVKKEDILSGMKLHHGSPIEKESLLAQRSPINIEMAH